MKTFASAAVLLLLIVVSATSFAERKQTKTLNLRVEIKGVSGGEVSLNTTDSKAFQSAVGGDWLCSFVPCIGEYNIEPWPTSVQLEGLKSSKTHVISSGNKKLKLGGIKGMKINSKSKSVTFNFGSLE